ncbi:MULTISPECIES: hypothetical protein [unclassified Xanthomonas]|uniref:hypothetical protein n=1 Tax=unclassified Xanthomonas TaxID=2643310 RepID=UPI002883162A|nr:MULTISPECIES: hypothetical protein [unclassified Xanthomonas]
MPRSTLSFREQIGGRLTDFLGDEGLVCGPTQSMLSTLVGALANYKEEGVVLTPTVLMCDSIEEVLRTIPTAIRYQIGTAKLDENAARKILKECAGLAAGDWFVYIEKKDAGYNFGVAASSGGPIAVSLSEAIRIRENGFAFIVKRIAESTVELVGAKGQELSLVFSTMRETPAHSAEGAIRKFVHQCTLRIESSESKKNFIVYLERMLTRVLEASHGTILICFSEGRLDGVNELSELVAINPAIGLYKAFCDFLSDPSAEALVRLQNFESLLGGLVNSDGIVALSDSADVVAYRGFFKPSEAVAHSEGASPPIIGGARRRAFEGVCACIGAILICALFRSQDGLILIRCQE